MADEPNVVTTEPGQGSTAFVLGYTGEVGKALVTELDRLKQFRRVVLVGRREVPLSVGPEFEQKIVDYDNIQAAADVFKGLDVGFCCLGTTKGKAGTEGFIKVDHDYVINSAEVAKAGGCSHFALVSSQGANKNSSMLYPRTKGQVEDRLMGLAFDALAIYRPGLLMVDRQESRPVEACLQCCLTPCGWCCPAAMTTPVRVVAMAMIQDAVAKSKDTVKVYENKDIHKHSTISDRSCCCC